MQEIRYSRTFTEAFVACCRLSKNTAEAKVMVSQHFKDLLGDRAIMFRGVYYPPDCEIYFDGDVHNWFLNIEAGAPVFVRYKKKYGNKYQCPFLSELEYLYACSQWPELDATCAEFEKLTGEQRGAAEKLMAYSDYTINKRYPYRVKIPHMSARVRELYDKANPPIKGYDAK